MLIASVFVHFAVALGVTMWDKKMGTRLRRVMCAR